MTQVLAEEALECCRTEGLNIARQFELRAAPSVDFWDWIVSLRKPLAERLVSKGLELEATIAALTAFENAARAEFRRLRSPAVEPARPSWQCA